MQESLISSLLCFPESHSIDRKFKPLGHIYSRKKIWMKLGTLSRRSPRDQTVNYFSPPSLLSNVPGKADNVIA